MTREPAVVLRFRALRSSVSPVVQRGCTVHQSRTKNRAYPFIMLCVFSRGLRGFEMCGEHSAGVPSKGKRNDSTAKQTALKRGDVGYSLSKYAAS